MQRSGTAGRDLTCCGVEAPSRPASRCCRGRFAGVTRRGMTTGESTSRISVSMAYPMNKIKVTTAEFEIHHIRVITLYRHQ